MVESGVKMICATGYESQWSKSGHNPVPPSHGASGDMLLHYFSLAVDQCVPELNGSSCEGRFFHSLWELKQGTSVHSASALDPVFEGLHAGVGTSYLKIDNIKKKPKKTIKDMNSLMQNPTLFNA